MSVGHEGSPSSFIQNADRYTDSIVNITVKDNPNRPKWPYVFIDGLARKPEPAAAQPTGGVQLPSGVAFNDEDIPF